MEKVIILNVNNTQLENTPSLLKEINMLLEKDFKIIILNTRQENYIRKDNIPLRNLVNLIELNYTMVYENRPAMSMHYTHNFGIDLNYPRTIIECVENIFSYTHDFSYTYIVVDTHPNRFTPILNDFFEQNNFKLIKATDVTSLEKVFLQILKNEQTAFYKISKRDMLTSLPNYEEILFSDRAGTLEDYALFFDKECPFNENMTELIELLKNKKFLLCGISSGNHNERFLSKNILKKLAESKISTENIIAFDQYCMASMIKNNRCTQSDKVMLGFGDCTKEECIKNFLKFLKIANNMPKKMYAVGDSPLDDIPMLKLIHSYGGNIGFITPYHEKDKIINAIKEIWLFGEYKNELGPAYELNHLREEQYYQMVRNVEENWDILKDNLYDDAKGFLYQIRTLNK